MENTRVVHAPPRRISTFGQTSFRFVLVTELMDAVDRVRVRDGMVDAERPALITPENISQLLLDGFGEKADEFAGWLKSRGVELAFLKYGFQIRKSHVNEVVINEPIASVLGRLEEEMRQEDRPLEALIHGVDDTWEVCLLKFTLDLIQDSVGGNISDFRKRGLL